MEQVQASAACQLLVLQAPRKPHPLTNTQALADRIAGVFVPTVLLLSALTAAAWLTAAHFGALPASQLPPGELPAVRCLAAARCQMPAASDQPPAAAYQQSMWTGTVI